VKLKLSPLRFLAPSVRISTPRISTSTRVTRHRRRHAARALGCGLLFFVAMNLALSLAMETVRPEWRDPEYGHRFQRLRRLQAVNPGRPLVLAIGSSRTQMGLSPSHMATGENGPIVYNLAHSGYGPIHLNMLLRRAKAADVAPQAVLIEYMPPAFQEFGSIKDLMNDYLPTLSLEDIANLKPYCIDVAALRSQWVRARLHPFYSMRMTLMSHLQPGWLPRLLRQDYLWTMVDDHGWVPYVYPSVSAEFRAKGLERMHESYFRSLQDFRIGPWQEKALRDMITICKDEGIRVAIYTMPESPIFRSWYTPETSRRSQAFLEGLRQETGVAVFETTSGFGEEDFADGHHMLRHAAKSFSRRLWEEHLQSWLLE